MYGPRNTRRQTALRNAQLEMPRGSADAIKEEGFLFLTQRSTGRQYNITVAVDKGSLRSPFHLTCTLPVRDMAVLDVSVMRSPCALFHWLVNGF